VMKSGNFLASMLVGLFLLACDAPLQTVSLTTDDFRFIPEMVEVKTSAPLLITIYNAGRETHEFDSPVLTYSVQMPDGSNVSSGSSGISLQPGSRLRLVVAPPPGTYLYICRRKGHANMTGTIIVTHS
jgi:plastocyanin